MRLHFSTTTLLAASMMMAANLCWTQTYPTKLVRIVTGLPGGSNDFTARLIAPGLSSSLGQSVIIDNRPSIPSAEIVAKAAPDGYTVLVAGGLFMIGQLLYTLSYDPINDFYPVSTTNVQPNILVVHPSLPVKSVKELVALAKAKPGDLNFASGSSGSQQHLAIELFKAMAGVNIVRINYKGTGSALNAMLGGEVHLMMVNPSTVKPYIESGRMKALAVTSAEPSALLPGLPTVAASGVPGFEAVLTTGVFVRAGTPAAIVTRLNQEVIRSINRPEVKERFLSMGTEPAGSTPAELLAMMKVEIARYAKVIKDAGIRGE